MRLLRPMRRSLLAALPLIVAVARAQPPAAGGGETIDVRVVDVDARVTDARGEPVRGLSRDDFRLLVDGRPVRIEYFAEVDEVAAGGNATSAGSAGNAPAPASERGGSFLVLIDDSLAVGSYRDAVLDGIERSLAAWRPVDQMAVVEFDGRKADVLSTWSSDGARLTAALERARRHHADGAMVLAHQQSVANDAALAGQASSDDGAKYAALTPEEVSSIVAPLTSPARDVQTRSSVDEGTTAFAGVLRALETPPGHKAVLLVSAGSAMASGSQLVAPLVAAAEELGYALYPVDASVSTPGSIELLDRLARPTGGAVLAVAKRDAFAQLSHWSSSYYSLGFTPAWKGDDRRHVVSVETVRRELNVRARGGYNDTSPTAEAVRRASSVALLGGDPAADRVRVALEDLHRAGKGRVRATLEIQVPVDALRVTSVAAGFRLDASFAVSVLDADGGRAELGNLAAHSLSPRQPQPGALARFRLPVTLRDVSSRVVVAVSDPSRDVFVWGAADYRPDH